LAQYTEAITAKTVNPQLFDHEAEKELALSLEEHSQRIAPLFQSANYVEVLTQLADLRGPVDRFFEHVLVMAEDKKKRENRLLLLRQLRSLFLQVADIALLVETQEMKGPASNAE